MLWVFLLLSCTPEIALSQTAKEYQQQASELARSYRFVEAVELLQTGRREHPGNLELARKIGELLVRTRNATEGERLLRDGLARQPHQLELLDDLALPAGQKIAKTTSGIVTLKIEVLPN